MMTHLSPFSQISIAILTQWMMGALPCRTNTRALCWTFPASKKRHSFLPAVATRWPMSECSPVPTRHHCIAIPRANQPLARDFSCSWLAAHMLKSTCSANTVTSIDRCQEVGTDCRRPDGGRFKKLWPLWSGPLRDVSR